jgi:hypothetical protein
MLIGVAEAPSASRYFPERPAYRRFNSVPAVFSEQSS